MLTFLIRRDKHSFAKTCKTYAKYLPTREQYIQFREIIHQNLINDYYTLHETNRVLCVDCTRCSRLLIINNSFCDNCNNYYCEFCECDCSDFNCNICGTDCFNACSNCRLTYCRNHLIKDKYSAISVCTACIQSSNLKKRRLSL